MAHFTHNHKNFATNTLYTELIPGGESHDKRLVLYDEAKLHTVTYADGVDGEVVFEDQANADLRFSVATTPPHEALSHTNSRNRPSSPAAYKKRAPPGHPDDARQTLTIEPAGPATTCDGRAPRRQGRRWPQRTAGPPWRPGRRSAAGQRQACRRQAPEQACRARDRSSPEAQESRCW